MGKHYTNIVTFCPEGRDTKTRRSNLTRASSLRALADELASGAWPPLDLVLLPGGYFVSDVKEIKALLAGKAAVKASPVMRAVSDFFKRTAEHSPDAVLVVGIDTLSYHTHGKKVGGQQLALAFNQNGLCGYARKIFPVAEDVDGKRMRPFIIHEADFNDPARIVTLGNGKKAHLNVCYDMFGIGDAARGKADKLQKSVMVEDKDGVLHEGKDCAPVLARAFARYTAFMKDTQPDLALSCIHRFDAPGRDVFWQRHGIASASAALDGGFAGAAAHFGILPANPRESSLASDGVDENHLEAGMDRKAHRAVPEQAKFLQTSERNKTPGGVVRLFKA